MKDEQIKRLVDSAKFTMKVRQGQMNALSRRIKRLEEGEELCQHHWNGSDNCFEIYCTSCGNTCESIATTKTK
jgi:hypothetical protein